MTALETEVATSGLLSFWILLFVCFIKMLFLKFCWWKLYNNRYKAFCDSDAYVIKRLLGPDVAQYYFAPELLHIFPYPTNNIYLL